MIINLSNHSTDPILLRVALERGVADEQQEEGQEHPQGCTTHEFRHASLQEGGGVDKQILVVGIERRIHLKKKQQKHDDV